MNNRNIKITSFPSSFMWFVMMKWRPVFIICTAHYALNWKDEASWKQCVASLICPITRKISASSSHTWSYNNQACRGSGQFVKKLSDEVTSDNAFSTCDAAREWACKELESLSDISEAHFSYCLISLTVLKCQCLSDPHLKPPQWQHIFVYH